MNDIQRNLMKGKIKKIKRGTNDVQNDIEDLLRYTSKDIEICVSCTYFTMEEWINIGEPGCSFGKIDDEEISHIVEYNGYCQAYKKGRF